MKFQGHQNSVDRAEWPKLEVTLGTNEVTIANDTNVFIKLVLAMDPLERLSLQELSGVDVANISSFEIVDQISVQLVLLAKFVKAIGLPILQEAIGYLGQPETEIFLKLADDLLKKGKYPEDAFAYSIYRRRGSPNTWLSISPTYTNDEIIKAVDASIPRIIGKVNHHLKLNRRFVLSSKVNDHMLYLLKKPTIAKVVRGEKKNIEVQGSSYTLIVLELATKRIGVVSGSVREVGHIQHYLTHKTFPNRLAPPRNDVLEDGVKLLNKIIRPTAADPLLLQGVELGKTALANQPSLRVRVNGTSDLDEAMTELESYWITSPISDLRQVEFGMPTGRVGAYKRVGLYTYGDDWQRLYFNTSSKNVPSLLENQFLGHISKRLGGNDIKTTRFILKELEPRFIIDKFLRNKRVSTNPAIPVDAEKMLVELTRRKLISKQDRSVQRMCWNPACYFKSWDHEVCPNCGRDEMRIISEAVRIQPNEAQILQQLAKNPQLKGSYAIKYFPKKQRQGHSRALISFYNPDKNLTTFAMIASNKRDTEYAEKLLEEGFGVIVLYDPKIDSRVTEIENTGITTISLTDALMLLTANSTSLDLAAAVNEQQNKMLQRLYKNAESSIRRLTLKQRYNEALFEIDLRNIMNIIVPDVVRLGAELTGTSVPDGYLRYGRDGKRTSGSNRKIFGWDAKYSQTSTYSLDKNDVAKQKKYIRWLLNPKMEPYKLGKLGMYGIVANFNTTSRMNTALAAISSYQQMKGKRVVLIEDMLVAKIGEWLLSNWREALSNTSRISDQVFLWLRRRKGQGAYTVSHSQDWPELEAILNEVIKT